MVRTKDELMGLINARIGDDTSDEAIAIIEDVLDTLNDYEARVADSTDWQARYEQNDQEWREKYKARFFAPDPEASEIDMIDNIDNLAPEGEEMVKTFEELFEEV